MNRNAILNAMEKKAKAIFEDNSGYISTGKRGMMIVEIRDAKNPDQWDSSCRSFGTVFRDYQYEGELVISNGTNFDALAHGKVAFCRRTNLNSGTNYYQVLGYESFWKGAIISDDGNCICAYAGFMGEDDELIAQAGITCYESLKRTGKSLATGGDPDYEEEEIEEKSGEDDNEEDGAPAEGTSVKDAAVKKRKSGRPKKK
jgi:hypothetical protein